MRPADSVSPSEVRELLEKRRGDWPSITKEVDVSHSWISKFVRGHIQNPGTKTLLELKAHLTSTAKREKAKA